MIRREKRVLLRHYLEQGMNKAVIARDLGVSRRTVYHWIETGQLDRELDEERVGYGPRCLMPSKLDPYKPLIDTRLKEYPKLTAVRLFKGPVKRHGIQVSKETWVTVGSSQEVADAVRGDPCRGRTKTLHR